MTPRKGKLAVPCFAVTADKALVERTKRIKRYNDEQAETFWVED